MKKITGKEVSDFFEEGNRSFYEATLEFNSTFSELKKLLLEYRAVKGGVEK